MFRIVVSSLTGLALTALVILAEITMSAGAANAVVYCKTAGVPKGCVVRPVAHPHVVYCKRVGYPKGCVMR
jgi:hypothetical protein